MTEQLAPETAAGPTTDALNEQPVNDRPVDVKPQGDEPKAEDKPAAKKSGDEARGDSVKKAIDNALKDEKTEGKPKEAKPESKPKEAEAVKTDEEPATAEDGAAEKPAAGRDGDEGRQSEGRKHSEPPARFLPEAREKWQNTPYQVKDEVHRISQEYEREMEETREIRDRYESIRKYDEIAKSNGRTLGDSLKKVVEIEQALARNPISGLDMILREVGPRKPDGSPMSIMEVAQFVASQSPEQMRSLMQQPQQQQRPPDPEVAGLKQQIQQMQTQMASATLMPVVEQFAAKHPDYHSLEPQIAAVLRSGAVDQVYGSGLSPEQKLAAAYRMAGGQPAPSHADPSGEPENSQPVQTRQANPAGRKSVAGSPNGEPKSKPSKLDRKSAIDKALREAGL